MNSSRKYFLLISKELLSVSIILFFSWIVFGSNKVIPPAPYLFALQDTTTKDTTQEEIKLPYPFEDRFTDQYSSPYDESPFYLKDPSNVETEIEYDPAERQYNINERIGEEFYRNPTYLSFDEFLEQEYKKSTSNYWKQRSNEENIGQRNLIPPIHVGGEAFDRIFGGNVVDIRPQGSAELIFAWNISRNDNPALSEKDRRQSTFDYDQKIQMNVIGNIGEKLKLSTNFNTEATFDFENKMKLEYTGKEDEIIKKIEAGNVTLPLSGSLITGSQSLFGFKTQLQFGRLMVTSVFSQQKGKTSVVEVQGGAQTSTFDILADQYEANKHYFLSQYFKDRYDEALVNLPIISSSVNITKVEVWITNKTAVTENVRNIVAFMDLGENNPYNTSFILGGSGTYPDNNSNSLYDTIATNATYSQIRDVTKVNTILGPLQSSNFVAAQDYEALENARKLSSSEYTINTRLGYISLNQSLNSDEVLAVAFEYTVGNTVYSVGELTTAGITHPQALYVKLLKSTNVSPQLPTWDLMMKNIYSIGAYQINNQDFILNVMYANDATGTSINYIPEGGPNIKEIPLIRVLNLDRLNFQSDPQPDGIFDFVDGITINASNGRVIFPVREPFGSYLRTKFDDPTVANKYVFEALYDSTKSDAQQDAEHNKFSIQGSYQSSVSSDIALNAINIPQGSVVVTAGGIKLTENVDYTVDYNLGRVKILNDGILNSGTPIKISLESNSLFSIQSKTFMGSRFDYMLSKNFNVGGTILHLNERPLTQKNNIGDEPISNVIWGLDGTYTNSSRLITKLIDKLPLIETKEFSSVTATGEFAHFIPGQSKYVSAGTKGTAYIDDFEGSKTTTDIKGVGNWVLASTPQGQSALFPEAALNNDLSYGFNRAKLSWYTIDRLFLINDNQTPDHIANDPDQQTNPFVRQILETDLFPNKEQPNNQQTSLSVLNLAYYPTERGHYNYDVKSSAYSSGLNTDGTLKDPETRWGGIMRKIESPNDFEAANVEFIEFWLMDPFWEGDPTKEGGELYFNLGNISEDILRDSRKSFEHGLPTSAAITDVDTTAWGHVPTIQAIVNVFDQNADSRPYQDVGLDGLSDDYEKSFFQSYVDSALAVVTSSSAASEIQADPSADNFHYYRSSDYDSQQLSILERYKKYNGVDGNSKTDEQSPEDYPTRATESPDLEDINRDNTLSQLESYYQYKVDLEPEMEIGENYITDIITTNFNLNNGGTQPVKWYQFKIPIQEPEQVIGNIEDFKSIRFMRMFFKGFDDPVICRFATLDLVRSEWRKYDFSLIAPGEYIPVDDASTTFDVSAVNLEENGSRSPIPYVLPEGIEREVNQATTNLQKQNEQSLLLRVCNLEDGDSRAAYKSSGLDARSYNRMKMFIHAESSDDQILSTGDLTAFIRLGTDFVGNYYEYEIPLTFTPYGSTSPSVIWPLTNELDVEFSRLQSAKQQRNNAMQGNPAITLLTPYTITDGNNRITVVGTPNLSNIKVIMIGVRNPKKVSSADDGLSKCAEIWVNELRLTDFDEKGGWAANARVTTKLADFGTLTLAGSKTTFGFGSLDKKAGETSKQDITQYDISSNLELGKFLPEKVGLRVPMYVGYSEAISRPQYNPLDPDILLKSTLDALPTEAQKDSVKRITLDYTMRKSINFTNVKKNKVKSTRKPRVYDIENFALTYAYTEIFKRNISTEYNTFKTYKGAVSYNYATAAKNLSPFAKSKIKSKYFKPIKDFNFYYVPSNFSVRADIDRQYSETQLRNTTGLLTIIEPTFSKSFTMTRAYNLKYDLTKSLKFDFNASNNSIIDEPFGRIDTEQEKDSIRENLSRLGRTTRYHHSANLNYVVPVNKFPLTDWITLNVRYGTEYDWTAASLIAASLGNTIENSNTIQYNGQFNMLTLYNKVKYLKKINQPPPPKPTAVKTVKAPKDTSNALKKAPVDTTKKENILAPTLRKIAKLMMSVKTVGFTYNETNGTLLPGYTPRTQILGLSPDWKAPGAGFIFGSQQDIRDEAVANNWLTQDTLLNNLFIKTNVKNLSFRSSAEPIKSLRIELTANRNYSNNHQEYFRANSFGEFTSYSPVETGNFSISYLTWSTAFKGDNDDNVSEIFERFTNYRTEISQRFASNNPNSIGYDSSNVFRDGYGGTSQDVLLISFLAAYSGKDPSLIGLNVFPSVPKPNWRITYDGLSKLKWAQKYFSSVSLSHSYRSTFNINSYTTSLLYHEDNGDNPIERDLNGNFISKYEISQVSISEQFSPLLSIDVRWKNSLLTRIEIKKDRTLSFAFSNTQLTEIKGSEIVIGLGYRLKKFLIPFKIAGKKKRLDNDLNLKADFSMRNNYTVTRQLLEETNQVIAGMKTFAVKTSADYVINEKFNLRFFIDQTINNPYVPPAFNNSNANIGISIRYTFAQ